MLFKKLIIYFYCLLIPYYAFTQEEENIIEELIIEQLGLEISENIDVSEFTERLRAYRRKPLDLNKAGESELNSLLFLSPQQIANILHHRNVSGNFISILELQGVQDLDLNTITRILPYIQVPTENPLANFSFYQTLKSAEQLIMVRYGRLLQKPAGYTIQDSARSRYLGDPNRYAVRYRMNSDNKIRIAINMEKDAGEPFFKEKQKYGFDFYGGYLALNDLSPHLKMLVVGDFGLQIGQGLISWTGLSFGKGVWIGSAAKQGVGLQPYASLMENNFQRGVAVKLAYESFEMTPFVAFNSLSGNALQTDSGYFISSLSSTGLHRTPTEQNQRKAVDQIVFGTHLSYTHNRLRIGLTYMNTSFAGLIVRGSTLRQQFDFEGKILHQIGVNYHYTYRNTYFYGETAHSYGGGYATNNGLIASLHPHVSFLVNYRNYQRNYHQFHAQSLSESSTLGNENGLYTGIVYHPSRKIEWVNYVDIFRFPWLKYRADAPSDGTDFLTQITYSWYKKGKISIRFRQRLKQENYALKESNENILHNVLRYQTRSDFHYKLNEVWTIRTRVEGVSYNKELEENSLGWIVYQDLFWKGLHQHVRLNMRIAYFDTDTYNSRLYAFENDVLYASSYPLYYQKGVRNYLNARIRVYKNLDIEGRYAWTKYIGQESIGTGLESIGGSMKSDFKIQIRWQR